MAVIVRRWIGAVRNSLQYRYSMLEAITESSELSKKRSPKKLILKSVMYEKKIVRWYLGMKALNHETDRVSGTSGKINLFYKGSLHKYTYAPRTSLA